MHRARRGCARGSAVAALLAVPGLGAVLDGDTVWASAVASVYSALMPKVRISAFVAAVMSTSLAVAAPAHADNGSDFLAMMSEAGINVGDTPEDVQLTLATAEAVCELFHFGFTPQIAGRQVRYAFPDATPQQITSFVDGAQAKLCTQAYAPVQPSGW